MGQDMARENLKMWIYPEDMQKDSWNLLPFKKDAFYLAIHILLPIISVVYPTFFSFYDPKREFFLSGTFNVEMLDVIPTSGLSMTDVSRL